MTVGFVGAGSWGTTLAIYLGELGHRVLLWGHGAQQRDALRSHRENRRYLPGIVFPDTVDIVETPAEAAAAPIVAIATPTQYIRSTLSQLDHGSLDHATVVSLSKGIENRTLARISDVLLQAHGVAPERFVALSGPSHAEEVARRSPTLLVAASTAIESARAIQHLFTSEWLRIYRTSDVVGVELGGALKNIIALCAGIIDGLEMGDNTKAALITRGLAEITRLGVALGAEPGTFAGLSGLGDLMVTCTSRHSRNRHVGEAIGRGHTLEETVAAMNMVAEGITTTESAYALAEQAGVETPIINEVHSVLFGAKDARSATYELMTRATRHEIWM